LNRNKANFFPEILDYCRNLELLSGGIKKERKTKLAVLAAQIKQLKRELSPVEIMVVCTHNSRRSHMGELWLRVGIDYYGLSNLRIHSAGTERSAINIRTIRSFQAIGLLVEKSMNKEENPNYKINWRTDEKSYTGYSKEIGSEELPTNGIVSILVCEDAAENCPFIVGSKLRINLPYEDPKRYDDTLEERTKYLERNLEIGSEMFYLLSELER